MRVTIVVPLYAGPGRDRSHEKEGNVRTSFIAGNWKMHKTRSEAVELASALKTATAGTPHKVLIAPPFTALDAVGREIAGSHIILGAQNMAGALEGAHTGEVSVAMLKDCGVGCVILGHSERRHTYGETDEGINAKLLLALENDMPVILCVGELLEDREAGRAEKVVEEQLRGGLKNVSSASLKDVTLAYEPVWAIGTGKTATPDDADAMHRFIRDVLGKMYSPGDADRMIIQYGGSVKPDNIKALMAKKNIDGALVGGASLTPDNFVPIVKYDA
jgi:triosephosphate isomerase (TIM)